MPVATPNEIGRRRRVLDGAMAVAGQLTGTWRRTADGYVMLLQFDAGPGLIAGNRCWCKWWLMKCSQAGGDGRASLRWSVVAGGSIYEVTGSRRPPR